MRRRTKEQVLTELPPKQEQVLEVELNPRHRRSTRPTCSASGRRCSAWSTTWRRTASRSSGRSPCCASSASTRRWSTRSTTAIGSAKLDALPRAAPGGGRRGPPGPGVQPVHRLPRHRSGRGSTPPASATPTSTAAPATAPRRIEQFKDGDAPVFLISLKAGGFGLNLTEADYCFVLDPWWNPATEAQAVDRTHRIGQDKHGHGLPARRRRARSRRRSWRSRPASATCSTA